MPEKETHNSSFPCGKLRLTPVKQETIIAVKCFTPLYPYTNIMTNPKTCVGTFQYIVGKSDTHGDRCCRWSIPGNYHSLLSGSHWLSRSTMEPHWTWSCRHSWELLCFLQRDSARPQSVLYIHSPFELFHCIHNALLSETWMDTAFPIRWPDAQGW